MQEQDQPNNEEISFSPNQKMMSDVIELLDKHSGFDYTIAHTLASDYGYMYKSPTSFAIVHYNPQDGDCLCHFVVGDLTEVLDAIQFHPKTISFERDGVVKTYDYDKFINKTKSRHKYY